MSVEIAAAALTPANSVAPGQGAGGVMQAGYNVSLTDLNNFEQSLTQAGARLEARASEGPGDTAKALMKPFEHINGEAQRISTDAQAYKANGRDMTPGEILDLSVRCQEFMFHCQLTSNIANRTADGLQQLFRQQS